MHTQADRPEFAPPPQRGLGRALVLAVLAHGLLLVALTWGVSWKREAENDAVEAELWSAIPQQAAPRLVEPPPPPPAELPPEPPAPPKPPVAVKPPPPRPDASAVKDAEIALEKERKRKEQEKREAERLEREKKERREKERLEKEKAEKEKAEKEKKRLEQQKEQDKREKEQREKELKDKERKKAEAEAEAKRRAAEADARKKKEADAAADAKRAEAQRAENLKRMQGLAGASGGPGSTGTALHSSGPSASYGGRIKARVKPNIVFSDDIPGNPEAEIRVRVAPDGTIVGASVGKSSGYKGWDDAVLRAVLKTETLPRDTDGRVPSEIIMSFRPKD